MKKYNVFDEIKLGTIHPEGWLLRYLEKQRDGLTGRQEVVGVPFSTKGWACEDANDDLWEAWIPQEQRGRWMPSDAHMGCDHGYNIPDDEKMKPGHDHSDKIPEEPESPKLRWLPVKGLFDQAWIVYEQYAYWVDGMIRCGYLLRDEFLLNKALKQIDYVLEHVDQDGYIGPKSLKEDRGRTERSPHERWPHVVFFRAMMAHCSATGDERVTKTLANHYLSGHSNSYSDRNVLNIEPILWAYEKTGNDRLLHLAVDLYEKFNYRYFREPFGLNEMLSDTPVFGVTGHSVCYSEYAKLGALIHIYTGDRGSLDGSINAIRKMQRDHVLIDGVPSGVEHMVGRGPRACHETCTIADLSWTLGYLLMATGNAEYGDMIERICLNAAPGAVTSDFRATQYYSSPNQVIVDKTSMHDWHYLGSRMMSYRPNHFCACCNGNVHRVMPNHVTRMWLKDNNNGLTAALYGPSQVTQRVGEKNQIVTIREETNYPFSETIEFTVKVDSAVEFPLSFRIPGWCKKAQVSVNGRSIGETFKAGTFFTLKRVFEDNDFITLTLPMELKLSHWPGEGIGIERGPLVYALKIEEDWQVDDDDERRTTPEFPAWNLYAKSPWNYALALDESNLADVEVVYQHGDNLEPWSISTTPLELRVPARRVLEWELEKFDPAAGRYRDGTIIGEEVPLALDECVERSSPFGGRYNGEVVGFTPELPDPETLRDRLSPEIETVTLVPLGCTKLRLTIFPQAK